MLKIKMIVDPPPNAPFGYRCQTFFVKIPTWVHEGLLDVCASQNKDLETVILEAIRYGLEKFKLEGKGSLECQ